MYADGRLVALCFGDDTTWSTLRPSLKSRVNTPLRGTLSSKSRPGPRRFRRRLGEADWAGPLSISITRRVPRRSMSSHVGPAVFTVEILAGRPARRWGWQRARATAGRPPSEIDARPTRTTGAVRMTTVGSVRRMGKPGRVVTRTRPAGPRRTRTTRAWVSTASESATTTANAMAKTRFTVSLLIFNAIWTRGCWTMFTSEEE